MIAQKYHCCYLFLLVASLANSVTVNAAQSDGSWQHRLQLSPLSVSPQLRDSISRRKQHFTVLEKGRGGAAFRTKGGKNNKTGRQKNEKSTKSPPTAPTSSIDHLDYDPASADAGSFLITDLLEKLDSSATGLTSQQASSRLAQYGRNALEKAKSKSILQLILEQFDDRLVQILLAVALLSAVFSVLEVSKAGDGEPMWKHFVEPVVICAILVCNAAVGVWQSQSASDSLDALQKLQPTLATVLRDGEWKSEMDASELVPGDVFEIRVGDKIPADARLLSLQSSSLQVDEGSLTGESVTVSKLASDEGTVGVNIPIQFQRGMLYSGTMVTRGTGRAMVVQTGMNTQFGKIQKGVTEAKNEEAKTPLAIKLDEFGDTLTLFIGAICIAVWIVSIPKFNDASFSSVWEGAIYYAKVAVALGVAAIPEGLPAVITLCLSLGTRRMAERNVIVRKLQSVETLGCTSVICTDKTGTLTTNEMTVVRLVLAEKEIRGNSCIANEFQVDGYSYSPVGAIHGISKSKEIKKTPKGALADVAAVCALCNDAMIVGNDHLESSIIEQNSSTNSKAAVETEKDYSRIGEPTEAALCILAEKIGGRIDPDTFTSANSPSLPSALASANVNEWRNGNPRQATLEFSRDRKSMSVICNSPRSESGASQQQQNSHNAAKMVPGANRLLVKGAPNLLLERCTHIKYRDGTVVKLTGEKRRVIETKISELAARPLRCLALAVKENRDLPSSLRNFHPEGDESAASNHPILSNPSSYAYVESGLTLVGVVGIKDPARPGVAESIDTCTKAGIRVIMITGDAKDTAVAIAKDVHIFEKDLASPVAAIKAFEGREFFEKSDQVQLTTLTEGNMVFCRAEPADKQKLVKMLQGQNEIPAMTGDGVNDAPALQQAAIGVAMGIAGTEVSKEAADMIIADDNFSTIVAAVEEGRRIYANMQSFICFLISCNIGEICAILFATIAGFPEPLTAMHLLWVNLVTDGPPATALGFNPPAPDIMDKPPRPSDQPILTKWLLTRYILTGCYVGFATIGIFVGHYLKQGITMSQLSNWSQCGNFWSPPEGVQCSDLVLGNGRTLPQTLALTTLVCMEMIKALSAVSLENSIFQVGPQSNPWLLLGVAGPFLLHLFVLYSSKFGLHDIADSLGLVPLSKKDWIHVLMWSAPILAVDEVLKLTGRWLEKIKLKKSPHITSVPMVVVDQTVKAIGARLSKVRWFKKKDKLSKTTTSTTASGTQI